MLLQQLRRRSGSGGEGGGSPLGTGWRATAHIDASATHTKGARGAGRTWASTRKVSIACDGNRAALHLS